MARYNGRALVIEWDTVDLVGVRTKSFNIANEHVDVTTDDDDGWITLLADPATRAIEVTVAGITENQILIAEMMDASVESEPLDIELPTATGALLSGNFFCTEFEGSGEHDGAFEFSATFKSSGVVTYTAGS